MIVAIVLTRAGRLRPSWQAAIWLVVAIKLALPWSPALPWSLSDLIASLTDGTSTAPVAVPVAHGVHAPPQAWPAVGWIALAMIWLAGAALVIVRALLAHRHTLVAARCAPAAPADAQALLRSLNSRVRLVVGDDEVGPHVVGWLRPIIVVPSALLADAALLRAALLHEIAHVRRRDALGRFIQIVASALMWWWPLARIVQRRLDLAREAACDAWALEAGEVPRPAYARLLVRMAALRAAAAPALATHHALDARVAAVLGPPARTRMGIIYRLVLAAWGIYALGGARAASARGHVEVCHYTTEMAQALYQAYPEADLDGDGRLSRDEACDLQAELRQEQVEMTPILPEPLCCNCEEAEVYSSPETVSCHKVEGVER
jgi:beta-lactamase regulating signal transducer with metallopeptidase domain